MLIQCLKLSVHVNWFNNWNELISIFFLVCWGVDRLKVSTIDVVFRWTCFSIWFQSVVPACGPVRVWLFTQFFIWCSSHNLSFDVHHTIYHLMFIRWTCSGLVASLWFILSFQTLNFIQCSSHNLSFNVQQVDLFGFRVSSEGARWGIVRDPPGILRDGAISSTRAHAHTHTQSARCSIILYNIIYHE